MATSPPPMEIINDILLRLPIKDILRSKCVAKAWYSHITSSHFVKLHLNRTLEHGSDSASGSQSVSERTMVITSGKSLQIVDFDSMNRICKLDYPPGLAPDAFLIGSCHGLICVSNLKRFDIALLNPATRTSRLVSRAETPPYTRTVCLGFGYDSRSNDYKVVMVTYGLGERRASPAFKRGIRVYSLSTNSWRLFSEEPSDEEIGSHGAVANSKMHWISIKPGREGKGRILSFDIEQEQLGEVPIPPYYGGQVHYPKEVGSVGGNLCFLTEANRGGMFVYIDVWMMKQYGMANSWTKLYSVWCLSLPYPVACSRTGNEVLYCEDGNLFWFNKYEQKKEKVEIPGAEMFSEAVVSFGSLVPVS